MSSVEFETINTNNEQDVQHEEQSVTTPSQDETQNTTLAQHSGLEYIEKQLTSTEFIPQIFQSLHTLKLKETINSTNNLETQTANIKHKLKLCKARISSPPSPLHDSEQEQQITNTTQDIPLHRLLSKSPAQWDKEILSKQKELQVKQKAIDSLQNKIKSLMSKEE